MKEMCESKLRVLIASPVICVNMCYMGRQELTDIQKHSITVFFFYVVVVSTVTLTLSLQRKYAVACRTSAA